MPTRQAPSARSEHLTAEPLLAELGRARAATDALFARVPAQALYARAIAERHRPLFYIGHLEAFDANLFGAHGDDADRAFEERFAFGIDPVDGELPSDRAEDWPSLAELREGARRARERVDQALAQGSVPADSAPLTKKLHAAIEHRWMHAETLAYLLNRLPVERPLRVAASKAREPVDDDDMVPVPRGPARLGAREGDAPFVWDNEMPGRTVEVPAFAIDRHMVSNGQFLRFIEAGGYRDPRWWDPRDWAWRTGHDITHPASWQPDGEGWVHVSRFDRVPFQADWPVHVSHAEASAYARWAGKRLPTEGEWQRAAYGDDPVPYPWGEAPADATRGNFDLAQWDPAPVDAHRAGASAFGVLGLLGNGWEWTDTPFAPFEGFRPYSFYRGYSSNFFDGRHYVLKGGSAHTAARLLRRSFRNWFQPHYPYVFAGFRCVEAR